MKSKKKSVMAEMREWYPDETIPWEVSLVARPEYLTADELKHASTLRNRARELASG